MAAQLVVGVVLRARGPRERHDAAGRAHLDQLRAVLDLVAHRLADLLDTVGDPLGDGEREDARSEAVEHRRIQVAAARRDRVPRRDDPGARDPSRVDRAHERDVEQQPAGLHEQTEVAHGREAGQQRAPAARDGAHQLHGRVVLDRAHVRRPVAAHQEVELHVHEPGEQRHVAELDDLGVARQCTRRHVADAVALDHDHARFHEGAGVEVEQPVGPQHDRVVGRTGARPRGRRLHRQGLCSTRPRDITEIYGIGAVFGTVKAPLLHRDKAGVRPEYKVQPPAGPAGVIGGRSVVERIPGAAAHT